MVIICKVLGEIIKQLSLLDAIRFFIQSDSPIEEYDLRIFTAMTKRHDQKHVREERFCFAYNSRQQCITKGSHDKNSGRLGTFRQELMQKPWKSTTYWFALYCWFTLHPDHESTNSPHPSTSPSTHPYPYHGQGPPTSIIS